MIHFIFTFVTCLSAIASKNSLPFQISTLKHYEAVAQPHLEKFFSFSTFSMLPRKPHIAKDMKHSSRLENDKNASHFPSREVVQQSHYRDQQTVFFMTLGEKHLNSLKRKRGQEKESISKKKCVRLSLDHKDNFFNSESVLNEPLYMSAQYQILCHYLYIENILELSSDELESLSRYSSTSFKNNASCLEKKNHLQKFISQLVLYIQEPSYLNILKLIALFKKMNMKGIIYVNCFPFCIEIDSSWIKVLSNFSSDISNQPLLEADIAIDLISCFDLMNLGKQGYLAWGANLINLSYKSLFHKKGTVDFIHNFSESFWETFSCQNLYKSLNEGQFVIVYPQTSLVFSFQYQSLEDDVLSFRVINNVSTFVPAMPLEIYLTAPQSDPSLNTQEIFEESLPDEEISMTLSDEVRNLTLESIEELLPHEEVTLILSDEIRNLTRDIFFLRENEFQVLTSEIFNINPMRASFDQYISGEVSQLDSPSSSEDLIRVQLERVLQALLEGSHSLEFIAPYVTKIIQELKKVTIETIIFKYEKFIKNIGDHTFEDCFKKNEHTLKKECIDFMQDSILHISRCELYMNLLRWIQVKFNKEAYFKLKENSPQIDPLLKKKIVPIVLIMESFWKPSLVEYLHTYPFSNLDMNDISSVFSIFFKPDDEMMIPKTNENLFPYPSSYKICFLNSLVSNEEGLVYYKKIVKNTYEKSIQEKKVPSLSLSSFHAHFFSKISIKKQFFA